MITDLMAEKCPKCGKEMESGYLEAESLVGGAKWQEKRSVLGIGGELLMKPNASGLVYLQGSRCPHCRILMLKY